jgi:hypothetical protein
VVPPTCTGVRVAGNSSQPRRVEQLGAATVRGAAASPVRPPGPERMALLPKEVWCEVISCALLARLVRIGTEGRRRLDPALLRSTPWSDKQNTPPRSAA